MGFRFVEHQADIAVQLEGKSKEELFVSGIEALINLLTDNDSENNKNCTPQLLVIEAAGMDDEELLVNILNELLFRCYNERWFPLTCNSVEFSESTVQAQIEGYKNQGKSLSREIKAATYHMLEIRKNTVWKTRLVFDV